MKNPVTTIKQSVHNNPRPYLAAAAVTGLVAGVIITRKLNAPVVKDAADTIDDWLTEIQGAGHTVYIMPQMVAEKFQQFLDAK